MAERKLKSQKVIGEIREKEDAEYLRTKMQEELVLQKLKDKGCRITKQRKRLLNVILREECASCKEIYYKAKKLDPRIGKATVYRMINLLEEIGAISRKNMYTLHTKNLGLKGIDDEGDEKYQIFWNAACEKENTCIIELDDHRVCQLSERNWYQVIWEGLKICGYIEKQNIVSITLKKCKKERESYGELQSKNDKNSQ